MREPAGNCKHCDEPISLEPLSGLYIHSEDGNERCWDYSRINWHEKNEATFREEE